MSRERYSSRSDALIPYGFELSVGVGAGIFASAVYYSAIYTPINEGIHEDRDEIASLEADANSLIFTRDYLYENEMLPFGLSYFLTETANDMRAEAEVVRDASPNQALEQAQMAGVGIGVGMIGALSCLVVRNAVFRHRSKKQSQFSTTQAHQPFEAPEPSEKPPKEKISLLNIPRDYDDDYTPPAA